MRPVASNTRRSACALVLLFLFAAAVSPSARAQETPEQDAVSPQNALELDLHRLLFNDGGNSFNDPVWRLAPRSGQSVVLLPLRPQRVDRELELTRTPISLRGGRFIGFIIPKAEGWRSDRPQLDFAMFTDDSPEALDRLLLGESEGAADAGYDAEPDTEPESPTDPAVSGEGDIPPVPERAPRIARRIVLMPDGSIKWGLDRSIPSAELEQGSQDNLYPYKLDPEQLREQEPPRPERITRQDGESSRDYAERRREQQLEQREKMEKYRSLRDALRDLPEEFQAADPPLIYAAFDVREGDELALQGPSPLPWELSNADLERIRQLARGGGGTELDEAQRAAASGLSKLVDNRHPVSARAVALSVMGGGLAGAVSEGDPGYKLITKLLEAKDPVARRIVLYAIARAQPQTRTTANLLEVAGQSAQGAERQALQLASLRTLLALEAGNPDNTAFLVTQVNKALSAADGPAASRVLDEVLAALDAVAERGRGDELDRVVVTMVNRIDFSTIPQAQRDAAIRVILRHAPDSAVAAGWLDVKLLRNTDASFVDPTLAMLDKAEQATPPAADDGAGLSQADPQPQAPGPAQGDTLKLAGLIPIDSANHGLIRALDSTDTARRDAAWKVVGHFRVVADTGSADTADASAKTFEKVYDSALKQPKTPATLVDFVANHDRQGSALSEHAAAGMLRLLYEKGVDPAASKRAAQQIVGSGRDYGQALNKLEPAARLKAVATLYEQLEGAAPLVIGLVADPETRLLGWFATQIQEGTLPSARDWSAYAGGEDNGGERALLQVASTSGPMAASAAAAALALNAGGTAEDQQRFAAVVGVMEERTEQGVAEAWANLKTQLYTKALKSAQGTYRVVVTRLAQPNADPAEAGQSDRRTELGVVELKVEGEAVSLSVAAVKVSVSQELLALRIESIASLRTFNSPDLADLPLSQMDRPMDLLPRDGGAWSGETSLPDGAMLRVSLEPAE